MRGFSSFTNRGNAYYHRGEIDRAIADYDRAILLNPEDADAYNSRGAAYGNTGEISRAIIAFTKAIVLNLWHAGAYSNRGGLWLYLGEWEKAKADFRTAKGMGVDIPTLFYSNYESVKDFEVKHGVKVPRDLAALLSRY